LQGDGIVGRSLCESLFSFNPVNSKSITVFEDPVIFYL
jgi:hypothetical protein